MLIKVTISAVFWLLLSGASFCSAAETGIQAWSVNTLAGKANTHPGPDCHNATLVAKGYEDEVAATSAEHISFYLEKFCHPSQKQPIRGNIIAVMDKYGDLAHTMFSLGNGEIFEKESGDGLFQNNSHMDPHYQIKKFEESRYFVNKGREGFRFVTYSCLDAVVVRQQMKTCEMRGEEIGIKMIRQEFQKMAFSESPEFNLSAEALSKMQTFATAIEQIKRPDPCFDYFKVMVKSIAASVGSLEGIGGETISKSWLRFPQRDEWIKALGVLQTSVSIAEANLRYLQATGREH